MKKELLTYKDPKSPVSETFRTLRTNIQFMNTDRKLRTLLVTSTFPGEGKSWITANLAVTFAQAGKRVILVDADMRKGRQYNIFGVLPKPGLSNYLSNMGIDDMENNEDVNIANYIQETDIENLYILTAGNVPPNPSELLVSRRMKQLLQELKSMCDLVIIDGTPCDLVTDSVILSRVVDSTVIVTAQKETKKENLSRIVKNIQNVGGRIAGVVVNKVDISSKKYNQSYYYGSISGGKNKKHGKDNSAKVDDIFSHAFRNQYEDDEEDFYGDELNNKIIHNDDILEDLPEKQKEEIVDEPAIETSNEDTIRIKIDSDEKNDNSSNEYHNDEDNIKIDEKENNENINKEENLKDNKIEYNKNHNSKKKNKGKNKKHNNNSYNSINVNTNNLQKSENSKNNDDNSINKDYQEVEAQVQSEGKISKVKIDQNLDERTKEILRQVNKYIETEKRKQGERH